MQTLKLKFSYKAEYSGLQSNFRHLQPTVNSPQLAEAVLQADGHQLIPEETPDWNAVELVLSREAIFHCNMHDLDFGRDGKLDPLCGEARKAVLNVH
nr:PREDICTED: UPF0728 protein C10orf53 homolog [Balearica regulorum gibbericeps]